MSQALIITHDCQNLVPIDHIEEFRIVFKHIILTKAPPCTLKLKRGWDHCQCLFFGRNIGQLTPKIIYFHHLRKYFLRQSIQKTFYLILKKEALIIARAEISVALETFPTARFAFSKRCVHLPVLTRCIAYCFAEPLDNSKFPPLTSTTLLVKFRC